MRFCLCLLAMSIANATSMLSSFPLETTATENLIKSVTTSDVRATEDRIAPSSDLEKSEALANDRILSEIKDHNELMNNLEYLSDILGPRLTGSERQIRASHWTKEKLVDYGLANVHLEPWFIAHAWYRGTARGRITAPVEHTLTMASAGWSPSTPGTIRSRIVLLRAQTIEDLQQYKGKLNGAIVVVSLPRIGSTPTELETFFHFLRQEQDFLGDEGVVGVLNDSEKNYGLLQMLTVSRSTYSVGRVPTAFLTSENFQLIQRLLKRGPVEIEMNLENSLSSKPVEVHNTVAEILGNEKPDEVVILGAHLDSWDLGTGATDNGTGIAVVLEAARALQKLALKPRRTIRFILFTGEEQGLTGSRTYVATHQREMDKVSAVLVHDTGTGRVLTIGMMENYQARQLMDRVLRPLATLDLSEPTLRVEGGSDHVPFEDVGVPAFWCVQAPVDYARTHHSQADTLDKVRQDDLIEGAQVMAAWAYNVAQLEDLLPRKSRFAEKLVTSH